MVFLVACEKNSFLHACQKTGFLHDVWEKADRAKKQVHLRSLNGFSSHFLLSIFSFLCSSSWDFLSSAFYFFEHLGQAPAY